MKKLLTFLLTALLTFAVSWAGTETITFSEQGYTNQQAITTVNGSNFTLTFDKGSNSNAPKYYTSGTAIRVYGGNSMTVTSTKTITNVEITFGDSDGSNDITANVGSYSDGTWTGSATSVKFTVGGTSGNRRFSAVTVTYSDGGTTPTETCATPTFTPASGTYSSAQSVEIASATSGATIVYTVNGETYNGITPVTVNVSSNTTIEAYATKTGYNNSPVVSAEYIINSGSGASNEYSLVTNTSGVSTIGTYVLVYSHNTNGSNYAMSNK